MLHNKCYNEGKEGCVENMCTNALPMDAQESIHLCTNTGQIQQKNCNLPPLISKCHN
eukprot:NODE_553_length_747_cov_341.529032_g544_i0.p2 GENE.NODE_553_length_747_cov_341.529032_g544_i0~~NODE_553_length_747_cov_341.529032_g544_i0.p2  ORF type:complete len:57 (+),score=6.33 NODE_553_length_747_cov_341.529032_g544_i0:510-680(+)